MIKMIKCFISDVQGLKALRYLVKNINQMDAGDYAKFIEIQEDYKATKDYKTASARFKILKNKMTSR